MAIDSRNCFWFGTEERMSWFSTPLQGADSSPSGWGADGTLLNGGGWGLHSWGSHKRYAYEWPASSSRETAQRMKSYRDGTFGRGLLYFLEPTIFTTNVLPAHWADPSMSLDNEAPSLVYGIEPVAVQTSGGANLGLPVTSAQYELSGIDPKSVPTPDSSVFIPIPTGHTLFLGAFYSSTGAGGVFATPVNNNGTLGTAVKLTEKPNSDTDVVTDSFSGDLRGVRLWVGRNSDLQNSSVTIAAMAGRIIESSSLPVYGPWVEQERNYTSKPILDSSWGSTWEATVTNSTATPVSGGLQINQVGVPTGTWLLKVRNSTPIPTTPGQVWSASFEVTNNGLTSITPSAALRWSTGGQTPLAPVEIPPGETRTVKVEGAIAPASTTWVVPLLHTNSLWPDGSMALVHNFPMTVNAPTVGDPLDMNVPDTDVLRRRWVGAVNSSDSVLESRTRTGSTAKQDKLFAGPWIGGQGHSGCRFLGTPSYVTNSPIEGGRIGFAASFVEVGSWVYG